MGILLTTGTVLPGIAQTEPDQDTPYLELTSDSLIYDLNQAISISGQIVNFESNTRDPTLNFVEITLLDSSGKIPTSSYTDDGTLCQENNCMMNGQEQQFKFKILPDSLGNFKLSTVLSSVLFDYGTYKIQVSTYQHGKITATSEIQINPPSVEEQLIIEQPIVFETCKSTMHDLRKELESTECSASVDFLVGEKLIVKGKVEFVDPTIDSKVSIENSFQKNQVQPRYVTVAIPYPKAMILDLTNEYVTTTGVAEIKDQTKLLRGMEAQLLANEDGSFSTYFELPHTIFKSGLYAVTVSFMKNVEEKEIRIFDEELISDKNAEIVVTTDKTEYSPGETVQISGQIQNSYHADVIDISIESPDISGYDCNVVSCTMDESEKKIVPNQGLTTHTFGWDYQVSSSQAAIGKYTITAGSSLGVNTQTSFFVTDESPIVQTVPSEPEESPVPKKIIKKFNRIADSNISITLDDMNENPELSPRVIQGSLFTTARGQESTINIQVSTLDGVCVIGQDSSCMVSESTRKPGEIYKIVTIDEENYKIRYSGSDVRLEKFSILPESSGVPLDIAEWDVQVIKEDQPTRFYYKVSYVNLE